MGLNRGASYTILSITPENMHEGSIRTEKDKNPMISRANRDIQGFGLISYRDCGQNSSENIILVIGAYSHFLGNMNFSQHPGHSQRI